MNNILHKNTWPASALVVSFLAAVFTPAQAFTPVQQPTATSGVPGNVLLALSVEFPTGLQVSYTSSSYTVTQRYEGYFDNRKCYTYSTANEVFQPVSAQNVNGSCPVNTQWSGNLLNWLTMTNVDQFRSVMTGGTRDTFSSKAGTHPGDTTGRTVLIRSLSDRNSYNPNKNLVVGTAGMPLAGGNKFVRSGGYGSKFIVSNASNFADITAAERLATCAATPLPGAAGTSSCFNIRVEVCVAVGGAVESNCNNGYSGVPKPEGLVQSYANKLRFAAFGYLNETGNNRSGGVLRSAMKSVGPVAATATGVTANTATEWDTATGVMFDNPDPSDATASAVTNSGLMNYLNKFGFAAGYKGNDPVSEMYYAAQLYLRGESPPTNYSDNLTAAYKDGFPVITGSNLKAGQSRDPIINSCQKNFILGLGDIYTHCDGNLPGSTKGTSCVGGTPSDPGGLNVQNLWDITRGLEGLGDTAWVGGSSNATPYIAGLAHWANTNDIRTGMSGKQTISTYWVDVLENTNGQASVAAASLVKSQYWLAAKYGGFDTTLVTGNNPNTVPASWDANADGIPDNWYAGNTPTTMKSGLSKAFSDIANKAGAGSASSAAVTSTRQTSNSQIVYAGYDPANWTGTVRSCTPTQTADQCANSPVWEASRWFKTTSPTLVPTPLTPATRKIFTSWFDGTTFTEMPFQWASLNPAQQTVLNAGDSQGANRLAYLRGDRTNENTLFRKRSDTLLGDIVNSGVSFLTGSGPTVYSGPAFAGHSTYRATTKTRPPVVFVGGNDGMLHAFSGADGKELFGYIPGSVFTNLPALTALSFLHKYFVDSTPMVGDYQKTDSTWGTMLVGGLGAGGKGYYGLDISNQSAFAGSSEGTLSAMPMWEFTAVQDADLGYTFNEPSLNPLTGAYLQIAKVADTGLATGQWRAIVGNGYGSTAGKAGLYLLNANTGAPATKLIADNGPNNGLSAPTPVDTDRDGLIDTIYAGDLLGNLHKFQFSKASGLEYVLAKSGDSAGAWRYIGNVYASNQPITTAPSVTPACDGVGSLVAFGTGKLNESGDTADSATRGFYTVTDNAPSSALTVGETSLATITHVTSASSRTWTTPNLTGKRGWKMLFTSGERVLSNSTLPPDTGAVLFATTKPTGDTCTPGNSGFIMAVGTCSGGQVGAWAVDSSGIIKVSPTYVNTDNTKQVIVCNQDGCKPCAGPTCTPCVGPTCTPCVGSNCPKELGKSGAPRGRYNWREILGK